MTLRRPAHIAITVAMIATVAACSDDGGGDCVGETSGSVSFSAGVHASLPGGGNAGIGSAFLDEDPPFIHLLITPATDKEKDTARYLEVGDSFAFKGADYTVAGFCEDKVWLNDSGG